MEPLGFKKITLDNWNIPDQATIECTSSFNYDKESGYPPYLDRILNPQLNENVPIEIQRLFEVARGVMVYSFFFYPLYTVATDQLSRVGEAALFHKAKELGYPKEKSNFGELINFLKEKGVLDQEKQNEWEFLRGFRNRASHKRDQSLWPPSATLGALERYTKEINALFS